MSAKKFTVLIIPEGSHKVRRFGVGLGLLRGVLAGALVLLVAASLIMVDYFRTHLDRSELHRLKAQNRNQQKELRRLTASLDDLRREMVIVAQNDARVRAMAKLGKPRGELPVGVGGPPEADAAGQFSAVQRQIDQIREAIDLRRESQEELQGFLNDQRSLLASRPKGMPVHGWITSGFGIRKSPFSGQRDMHEGIDIAARTGTPVNAAAAGIVTQAQTVEGYGKLVVVDHGYGFKTYYGHNSRILVTVGQRVRRGERIAAVGNTGSSTGSHLHYEVRRNGVPVNPRKYF